MEVFEIRMAEVARIDISLWEFQPTRKGPQLKHLRKGFPGTADLLCYLINTEPKVEYRKPILGGCSSMIRGFSCSYI